MFAKTTCFEFLKSILRYVYSYFTWMWILVLCQDDQRTISCSFIGSLKKNDYYFVTIFNLFLFLSTHFFEAQKYPFLLRNTTDDQLTCYEGPCPHTNRLNSKLLYLRKCRQIGCLATNIKINIIINYVAKVPEFK